MSDARLVPCPACARHVRCSEKACPFCDVVLPASLAALAPISRVPLVRLGRAALFALGAGAVAFGASCQSQRDVYRAPPADRPPSTTPDASAPDATDAITDAAPPDAASVTHPHPIYGAPPHH